jgi:RNA polymerase sigma factor FliA
MTQLADTPQLTPEARRLIEDNLPLVDHITKRVTASFPRHVEREELARAGMLGLVEAAARFDPERGRFAAFAGRRIEGAILDEVRRRSWAPRSVRSQARSLGQLEEALTHQLGRAPGDERLAEAAGLTLSELAEHRARSARGWVDTLDRPAGDEAGPSLAELVTDPHACPTEERVEEDELRSYLRSAVVNLPERHRLVIVGYFLEGRSMEELARLLGVSQSRVSQLKDYALSLMRCGIESQYAEAPTPAGSGRSQRARAAYAARVAGDGPAGLVRQGRGPIACG